MNVPGKMAFVNLTPQVAGGQPFPQERRQGRHGAGFNSMHITSSVFTLNDNEGGLHHDFGKWLEKLAPFNPDPQCPSTHNRTGEDNADVT